MLAALMKMEKSGKYFEVRSQKNWWSRIKMFNINEYEIQIYNKILEMKRRDTLDIHILSSTQTFKIFANDL